MHSDASLIGQAIPRKEGREKVTGRARYVDDLAFPGMLHGVTVRSPAPRGRIRAIHFDDKIPWKEFTVVTAKDIPGENCIALILHDQPCLAAEFVNHAEEPVVLLAHPDKYLLEEARRAVQHAGKGEVVHIARAAGDFLAPFLPRYCFADE